MEPLTISPYATNVMSLVDATDIVTGAGQSIRVEHHMSFKVYINDVFMYENSNNICASMYLNSVGVFRRS